MLDSAAAKPEVKLARGTEWVGEEQEAISGTGQRMLLVGEDPISILEIQSLVRGE
jgi:protein involved in temperature-dependent protein secretion